MDQKNKTKPNLPGKSLLRSGLFAFGVALFLILPVFTALSAPTAQINYQGKLSDSSGNPVADGTYNMRFKLCTDSTCSSSIFDETYVDSDKVTITDGLFSVMLGSVSSTLDTLDFNQTLYLEVNVGGSGAPSWETLLPRKIIGSVPNAFNAQKLDGLATTSFLRADLANSQATITNLTSTNFFATNASATNATSTNLFASIFNAITGIIDTLTATIANITTLVFGTATGNDLSVTNLNVTSTANILTLNASSTISTNVSSTNVTTTNFYATNATITGGSISTTTIANLLVSNFASPNISQWTNDSGYLTSVVADWEIVGGKLTPTSTIEVALATTTVSFDSKIGDSSTYFTVTSHDLAPGSNIPVISFTSPNFSGDGVNYNWGAIEDGLIILEQNRNPSILLVASNFSTASITHGTSSDTLYFSGVSHYTFDSDVSAESFTLGGDTITEWPTGAGSNWTIESGLLTPSTTIPVLFKDDVVFNAAGVNLKVLSPGSDPVSILRTFDRHPSDLSNYFHYNESLFLGRNAGPDEYATTSGLYDSGMGANIGIGDKSLYNVLQFPGDQAGSGSFNNVVGWQAGYNIRTGNNNNALGDNALALLTSGDYNIGIGSVARAGTTGDHNIGMGYNTNLNLTSGSYNLALGYWAGAAATSSSNNIFIGTYAGDTNGGYAGDKNIVIGDGQFTTLNPLADHSIIIGYGDSITMTGIGSNFLNIGNTIFGTGINQATTTGKIGIGTTTPLVQLTVEGSGYFSGDLTVVGTTTASCFTVDGINCLTSGSSGVSDWEIVGGKLTPTSTIDILASQNFVLPSNGILKIGEVNLAYGSTTLSNYFFGGAGNLTMSGSNNTAFGSQSLHSNIAGSDNVALGTNALYSNTDGNSNLAFGDRSLYSNITGGNNIAIGINSLNVSTSSHYNTAVGNNSLSSNTAGYANLALGYATLYSNTIGNKNLALGYNSLYSNTTGDSNIALGYISLYSNTTGTLNTVIGHSAGYNASNNEYNSITDSSLTLIGAYASRDGSIVVSAEPITNATAIGYNAKVGGSNMMALGGLGADAVKVGIGTSTPAYELTVIGDGYFSGDLTVTGTSTFTDLVTTNLLFDDGVTEGSISLDGTGSIYLNPGVSNVVTTFFNATDGFKFNGVEFYNSDGLVTQRVSSTDALFNTATSTTMVIPGINDNNYLKLFQYDLGGELSIPMIQGAMDDEGSPEYMTAIYDSLMMFPDPDGDGSRIMFLDNTYDNEAKIKFYDNDHLSYPNYLTFERADKYYFDNDLTVAGTSNLATTTLGSANNYFTFGTRSTGFGTSAYIKPNAFDVNGNYGEWIGGLAITEGEPNAGLSYGGMPTIQFGPSDFSSGAFLTWSTSTGLTSLSGYGNYSGFDVSGTTTLDFNSYIGDSNTHMWVKEQYIMGMPIPLIGFTSNNFNVGDDTHNYGAMEDGLILYENVRNPSLMFVRKSDSESVNISYVTTTNQMRFTNADSYYFDNSIEIVDGGDLIVTSLATPAGSFLAVDADGLVIATTTPTAIESDPIWTTTSSNYLTTAIAAATYQPLGSYLTVESDPIWIATSSNYFTLADWYATTTDGLDEGLSNKYYTQARVWDDIWASSTLATILNNAITSYDWQIVGGKLTPTSTIDILASQDFVLPGDGILKLGDTNLAYGSSTLNNWFFGGAGNETATGKQNTGFGYTSLYNNQTGNNNTAIGFGSSYSNLSGSSNIGIGYISLFFNESGTSNTAIGANSLYSNVSGSANTGIGYASMNSNTTGIQNTAIGYNSLYYNATGTGNIALGYHAGIGGDINDRTTYDTYSTFIGHGASRDGTKVSLDTSLTNATAIGYNAKVGASNTLVLGGTGDYKVNVGIGTSTPSDILHLEQDYNVADDPLTMVINNTRYSYNRGTGIDFQLNTGQTGEIRSMFSTGAAGSYLYGQKFMRYTSDYHEFKDFNSDTNMIITSAGNVGIGTIAPSYRLQVGETTNYGYVAANGAWTASSDVRFKENIAPIDNALGLVLQMEGIRYNTVGDTLVQVGFSAQDLEKILPEVVSTDNNGYKGVSYSQLTPILVQAIKEQQSQILALSNASSSTILSVSEISPFNESLTTLSVSSAATFYGTINVIGEAGFESKVTFKDDVEIEGKLYLDKDQVGTAIIRAGSTTVEVLFDKPFRSVPRVVANLNLSTSSIFARYAVTNKTTSSFTIIIDAPAIEDLSFDWVALGLRTIADQFDDLVNDEALIDDSASETGDSGDQEVLVVDNASSTDGNSSSTPTVIDDNSSSTDGVVVVGNPPVTDETPATSDDPVVAETPPAIEVESSPDSANIGVADDSGSAQAEETPAVPTETPTE